MYQATMLESYETYKNGKKQDDVVVAANYDGDNVNVKIHDKVKGKKTNLKMTDDELFDLFTHKQAPKSLMSRLESFKGQRKKKSTRRKRNGRKRRKHTRRRRK